MPSADNDALEAAFEAGYEKALQGVWYADATTSYEPAMFAEWLKTRPIPPGGDQ